jgi:para-aminobenzoate synthetase/4-amino-4-deoxychorismate lyase
MPGPGGGVAVYYPLPLDAVGAVVAHRAPAVVLDTAAPSAGQRYSYLFVNPCDILAAGPAGQVPSFFRHLEKVAATRWLAGYVAYEAAYGMEPAFRPLPLRHPARGGYLAWMGVFDEPYIFDHLRGTWNRPLPSGPAPKAAAAAASPPVSLRRKIIRRDYLRAVRSIKRLIAAGHTYQVNFTFDVGVTTGLEDWAFYRTVREAQKAPYCAYIANDRTVVCSFSPEMFFRKDGARLTVKPMKGTAPRGRYPGEDRRISRSLQNSVKNRAENIMIVDLLRNDLGKICRHATVRPVELLSVERHETLFQMTSTVSGVLEKGLRTGDVFHALFPSGSVTGAPKIRTMEIICSLEKGARGVYCGAIGFASPDGRAVFSVPIRTLQKRRGGRVWNFRVGSGIVWDSEPLEEWEECKVKSRFLVRRQPDFELLESVLWDNGWRYLKEHLARMRASAGYFGVPFSADKAAAALDTAVRTICRPGRYKVRLLLGRDGAFRCDSVPLGAKDEGGAPARLLPARMAINEREPFLFHKTTHRPWYAEAARMIAQGRCFDMAFFNSRGQLTEGARSNIFIRRGTMLYTPPVECGLLDGVLRQRLIRAGKCREKVLRRSGLLEAKEVFCGNSVRGLVRVRVQ